MSTSLIRNPSHAAQLKDFGGLRFGQIAPTDVDAMLEIHDRLFVVVEIKTHPTSLHGGQRLALARMIDALEHTRPSILIVGSHAPNGDADIDVGACSVTEYRNEREWRRPMERVTVRHFIERFIEKHGIILPAQDRGEYAAER